MPCHSGIPLPQAWNDYDYNKEVMDTFGRLRFPVCSIAISHLKRGPEARACASAILNAVETILHRLGLVFMNRRTMVLGSSGAIGRFIVRDLSERFGPDNVCGIDIDPLPPSGKIVEVRRLIDLDKSILYDVDTFIGVIGKSILGPSIAEEILTRGRQTNLFFVSGSTKTVEFKELENWLQLLSRSAEPRIGGVAVAVKRKPLRDPQTGILQGHRVSVSFMDGSKQEKHLYLLAGLTPINFLYYGIPAEAVDPVVAQLLSVSCGLVESVREGHPLPSALLAVDHEIDENAHPLI